MNWQRLPRSLLVFLLATAMVGSATASYAKPTTATVTVLHALPGFTADVYVNGELTLSGFEPETATDPLELPAGRYTIEIRDVGADPSSEPALEGSVRLKGGENLSIIAGLTEGGDPELNVFPNATTPLPAGRSQLIVRNVADVASVGVLLDGARVMGRVAHGGEGRATLEPGGPYPLEALVGGETAIGPEDLSLAEGTVSIVYAVGSAEQDTLGFMFQTIRGLETAPGSVLTGDGGLAGSPAFPAWAVVAIALALLGFGAASTLARERRDERPAQR